MQELALLLQLGIAFTGGLSIALSPCLFPLLPLFLLRTLQSETSRKKGVLITLVLVLGLLTSLALFILVLRFVIGAFILTHFTQINAIMGGIIIILGIIVISERLRMKIGLASLSLKSQPSAPTGYLSVFVIGLGYSLLAAPCAAPTILALVGVLGSVVDPFTIALLFILVSIAVAIPYLMIALVTGEARTRLAMRMTQSVRKIEMLVGALLVVIGIILVLPMFGITLLY